MNSTTKTRLYLLLIAILPPLLMVSVIYFYSIKQYEQLGSEKTYESIKRFEKLQDSYLNELKNKAIELSQSSQFKRAVLLIKSGRMEQVDLSQLNTVFDVVEIIDSSYKVLASGHRPGFVGELVKLPVSSNSTNGAKYFEKTEYDMNGLFAGFGYIVPLENDCYLYLSKYIDSGFILLIEQLLMAKLNLYFADESNREFSEYANLSKGQLFQDNNNDSLIVLLAGNKYAKYILLAKFDISEQKPIFFSLLRLTGVVALVSVFLAILVGIYITGQTKKR